MTAVAVNCFPTEPDWKIVSGLTIYLQFHVGQAEAFGPHNLSVLHHKKGQPGDNAGCLHLLPAT